jgi:hypothetical protein
VITVNDAAKTKDDGLQLAGAISVSLGGVLIIAGWFLPWASSGAGSVTGTSEVLALWFRTIVLGTGVVALACGIGVRWGHLIWRVGIGVAAAGVLTWSLVFPAATYLGARTLAGFAGEPASIGSSVTYMAGSDLIAAGGVLLLLGSGAALTERRWVWVASGVIGLVAGVLMFSGFH